MTKKEKKKKNKFDRTAYMRDYMRDYNQTDDGKKNRQKSNANYQKSEKGKETRKKWLANNPESVQKSSEKYRKTDKWKEAQKRTTAKIAILTREGYAGAVKALRTDLGLSQTQASEKTGVPVATIRQTERGAVYLSEERLKEYANKLGYEDETVAKIVEFKYPVQAIRNYVEEELANHGISSDEADEYLLRDLIEKSVKKVD